MYDLHVARHLTHDEAKSVLAEVLNVADPVIVESLDADIPDEALLWCVVTHRPGDFQTSLELYPRTMADRILTEEELACRVAHVLECDVLVSDDDLNPLSWLLMDANCQPTRVTLDAAALEQHELKVAKR